MRGWLREEWNAAGVDFATRGRRLQEALGVCHRLWTDPVVEHCGEFFKLGPVAFAPKPVQRPLPVYVGGESAAALRRAVTLGTGWIGMHHTPDSVAPVLGRLGDCVRDVGRTTPMQTTAAALTGPDVDVPAWRASGIDRVLVAPWQRRATLLKECAGSPMPTWGRPSRAAHAGRGVDVVLVKGVRSERLPRLVDVVRDVHEGRTRSQKREAAAHDQRRRAHAVTSGRTAGGVAPLDARRLASSRPNLDVAVCSDAVCG